MEKVEKLMRPLERIGSDIKKSAWAAAIESLVVLIFGILIIAWPDITVTVIANILGVIFISGGVYKAINFFVTKGHRDYYNNDLLTGVIFVLIGIMVIVMQSQIAGIFRVVVGIWTVYESLVRMNSAMKLHQIGIGTWKYVLILAIAMLIVGLFVTFNIGAVIMLIGWMMVVTGIVGIIGDIMFIQQVDKVTDYVRNAASKAQEKVDNVARNVQDAAAKIKEAQVVKNGKSETK